MSREGKTHRKKKRDKMIKLKKPPGPPRTKVLSPGAVVVRTKTWGFGFGSAQKPPEKILIYDRLPMAADTDGECSLCRTLPNKTTVQKTDQGSKDIVVCANCGHKMIPFRFR